MALHTRPTDLNGRLSVRFDVASSDSDARLRFQINGTNCHRDLCLSLNVGLLGLVENFHANESIELAACSNISHIDR